jgi:hypothetical protein
VQGPFQFSLPPVKEGVQPVCCAEFTWEDLLKRIVSEGADRVDEITMSVLDERVDLEALTATKARRKGAFHWGHPRRLAVDSCQVLFSAVVAADLTGNLL